MSRLAIEAIAVFIFGIIIFVLWEKHDTTEKDIGEQKILAADKAATDKQKTLDEKKFSAADLIHAQELAEINAAYRASTMARSVCYTTSGALPTPKLQTSTSSPAAVVSDDQEVYRERGQALDLLTQRADQLAADTRELNAETH